MSQSDFVSRGQALVAAGQFQEAVKVCRLGLLGRPTTVDGRVVLGQALLALKRFDEVLAEMRVALELDPTSVAAQVLRAEALLRKGDAHAAIEALHQARQVAPGDPRILQLLGEAEHGNPRAQPSASHPAVGFVGNGDTGHYPTREPSRLDGEEDSGGSFTQPTSLSGPSAIKRTSERAAAAKPPSGGPSRAELAVGDRSGTVEVDPELDGVELGGDDFDDLAAPPVAARGRAQAKPGSRAPRPAPAKKESTPAIAIEDEDMIELAETRLPESSSERRKPPGPGTAVRNAVRVPPGPLDERGAGPPSSRSKPITAPPLARTLAAQPHMIDVRPPPPATPLPPPPGGYLPPAAHGPVAAALPTMAAAPAGYPPPAMPLGSPPPALAGARPAGTGGQPLTLAQQQSAAAVDAAFAGDGPPPSWARATVAATPQDPRAAAAAFEPTARPDALDPALVALMSGTPAESGAVVAIGRPGAPGAPAGPPVPPLKTGMRRPRSRLQIAMWILIGAVVIGGGVFAGFQIRSMRLKKEIAQAHEQAADLAKADTWTGWLAARDRFAGILQASDTIANRAALARARALIAFEFGDGLAEAKAAVDGLAGQGGLDGDIAAAYLALAENDAKAAKQAADAALAAAPDDAGALYVAGRAALLAGDVRTAANHLRAADQKQPRPLYGVGLARALAAASTWDDASAVLDHVLAADPGHPAALIARGELLAAAGRVAAGSPLGNELHLQLAKVAAEGGEPPAQQAHGVSPEQVALADLALARVDFARGEVSTSRTDVAAAAGVGVDDQLFAEEAIDTLFAIGDVTSATSAADKAMATWPTSRRARLARAEIAVAQDKPQDALDLLAKQADVVATPRGRAVRGEAKLALGDLDGARADFDAALQQVPTLEAALIGRTWIDLATGDVAHAKQRIEPRYHATGATAAITTAYAAVLRASGDPAARDKAKAMLEKVVSGPPGPDVERAQLELARLDRDVGDYRAARAAYAEASRAGNDDAKLEYGLLLIDDADPLGGRDQLDQLYAHSGDHPSPRLVLEDARARMLAGDHQGAQQLLEVAGKLQGVSAWKLARERGRLALRKGDYAKAASELSRALDGCGGDAETYLLAADVVTSDATAGTKLADKVSKLAAKHLAGRPEAAVVQGKLLLAAGKTEEAQPLFQNAKDALIKAHAPARHIAQARFGIAVTKYLLKHDAEAEAELEVVRELDPSLYAADLFMADLLKDKDHKQAFEIAKHAVALDPDLVQGWWMVGKLAAALHDRKQLANAIGQLSNLAPDSPQLQELQGLRR